MKSSKNLTYFILAPLLFIILNNFQLQAQSCDCTEFIYLNEVSDGGKVHKFSVAADGTLTEVLNAGNAWYPGADTSQMPSPHGLGTDLNGYLYIGETEDGDIRRLTCDGQIIPESTFVIQDGGYNIGTIDNSLYVNPRSSNTINEYDLCTGALTSSVCLNIANNRDWGFYVDPNTEIMYATSTQTGGAGLTDNGVFKFTQADFGGTDCLDPFIPPGDDIVNIGDNEFPNGHLRGITTDTDGNIYVLMQDRNGDMTTIARSGRLLKYDVNGNLVADSGWDTTNDLDGLFFAVGIVYSETSGTLFISRGDPLLNCVQQYDTNLNDLGVAVAPAGETGEAKGIAILNECCPTPNDLVIDTVFCDFAAPSDLIFLQDLIDCNGTICEGMWTPDPTNTGITYNDCNNSLIINSSQACGTFSLFSDGSNAVSQCGQFSITLNIETIITPTVSVTGNQDFCPGNILNDLSATTNSGTATYQWQMSTDACTGPWTDIAGATSNVYTPPTDLAATTYYQVVVNEPSTCATGNCGTTSECITLSLRDDCCPPQICLPVNIIQN